MRRQVLTGLRVMVVLTVLVGLAYPLAITGVAQTLFARRADGSLVRRGDAVVGSSLIGQRFTTPGYFQPRPSAAGERGYDARASGATNLGPSNRRLLDAVADRVEAYRRVNGLTEDVSVPVDAVTSSASGLDPDISVANARLQARRVARARRLPLFRVLRLIDDHTTDRALGFLGEKTVNVLGINLALDRLG